MVTLPVRHGVAVELNSLQNNERSSLPCAKVLLPRPGVVEACSLAGGAVQEPNLRPWAQQRPKITDQAPSRLQGARNGSRSSGRVLAGAVGDSSC